MSEGLFLALLLATAPGAAGAAFEMPRLTVRRAVELALERAPEVAVARAASEEAAAGARVVASERNPQFFVNTTPGWSTGVPLAVAGEVPAAVGARARILLYDPTERGEELQGQARALAFEGALADARSEVARRTVEACARLSADEARAASARRSLSAREAMAARERALTREGRRTELDVERAALEEARARQRLYAAESDRDLDRYELARLVGLPAGAALSLADDPQEAVEDPQPGDSASLAVARDRQLKALTEQSDALGRSAKLLAQVFKPSVNAEARYAFIPRGFGYDKYYLNFQENVASVGVSIVLPVLTGGRESARAAQSRARLEQVEAQRRLRESEVAQQAREAEARLARSGLEAGLARRAVSLAEEALSQAQALAREGRGEADGVERAQLALSEAEEDRARALREQAEARLRLLALRGELLSALGLEPAPPEP
ncbi:MAG: TolC family protein [Acidobacteriota bacterium]